MITILIIISGMLVSVVAWGYLADNKGRKQLLIYGFLLDGICVVCGSMSQTVVQLMVSKFIGGFIICGPFAVLMSYLSEFHGSKHRSRIIMVIGIMFATSNIILSLMAIAILPRDWNFQIFNMNFVAWKVFMAVSGVPSLLAALLLPLFPESPRFLMAQGRVEEAMEAFRTMYALNSGKPKDTYKIKALINEKAQEQNFPSVDTVSNKGQLKINMEHEQKLKLVKDPNTFRILCSKPYLGLCLLVGVMQFFSVMGHNSMRLWLPQLFASINEYEQMSLEATSLCTILEYSVNKTELIKNPLEQCIVIITPSSYTNNLIVAGASFVSNLLAGTIINAVGSKGIQVIGLATAGLCSISLFWSSSSLSTLVITSLFIAMGSMANTAAIGTSVNLFPTSLRTLIVSLTMVVERMGTILGNVIFPIFMQLGCVPPFVMITVAMFFGCLIAACLPNSKKINLK
ncbi:synaptic vesicle glycoprotein 2B [Stomoxys calcitrans]|uniref:synaptic vesicle glycoprotein 2B n=1 Tax=Stomoxys calcitrans TaxID=35570 RepID=UPI0027E31D41|nr:synaptic vesicle glycoprotein 2B [Stomoxys calcitrans]